MPGLPFLYRTALTPILLFAPDLSVNSLASTLSSLRLLIAMSAFGAIEVVTCGLHLVSNRVALIVSSLVGCMLYQCMRSCKGVGCFLTSFLVALSIGLWSGCVVGSVTSQSAALQYIYNSLLIDRMGVSWPLSQ